MIAVKKQRQQNTTITHFKKEQRNHTNLYIWTLLGQLLLCNLESKDIFLYSQVTTRVS